MRVAINTLENGKEEFTLRVSEIELDQIYQWSCDSIYDSNQEVASRMRNLLGRLVEQNSV